MEKYFTWTDLLLFLPILGFLYLESHGFFHNINLELAIDCMALITMLIMAIVYTVSDWKPKKK